MPHTTQLDSKDNIVTVTITDLWTETDAAELDQELKKLLPQSGERHLAIDLDKAIRYEGTEARRRTAKVLVDYNITRLAAYNARPAVRILVKILLKLVADATEAKFFSTRQEAVTWLKQAK